MNVREQGVGLVGLAATVITAAVSMWLALPAVDRPAGRIVTEVVASVAFDVDADRERLAQSPLLRTRSAAPADSDRAPLPASDSLPAPGIGLTVRDVQAMQRRGDRASRNLLVQIANDGVAAEGVRLAAVRALGDLPAPDDDALAALWRAADGIEPGDALAQAALCALGRALSQLPVDDERAARGRCRLVEALRCAMTEPRQRLLLLTLAQAGHPDLATEALPFLQSGDAAVRAAAAQAVATAEGLAARQIVREVAAVAADAEVRRILSRSLSLRGAGS